MKRITIIFPIILLTFISSAPYGNIVKHNSRDYVPDKETAIRIAEAIWLPIYGNGIYETKPFVARLNNANVWIVEGTLDKDEVGGVPYIEIQKKDCKILNVIHTK
jgi:hypothetical protein